MKTKMTEEDKIALVLEKAPAKYAGILAATEKEKGDKLEMEDLEEAMEIQHQIRYGDTGDEDSDENEINLEAFDGVCWNITRLTLI